MTKLSFRVVTLLLFAWAGFASFAQAGQGAGKANDFGGKRVMFVGIDGCRVDALRKAVETGLAPHLKELFDGGTVTWKARAGGELGTKTEQPTISGPGWTSICTGVWMDVHHVDNNNKPPFDEPETKGSYQLAKAPHFASYLKAAHPMCNVASLTSWGWIEDYLLKGQTQYFDVHEKGIGKTYAERDEDVKTKAVALLGSSDPDFLFLHFDQMDGVGHGSGFNPENVAYLMALRQVDGLVGEILAARKSRPKANEEEWLTILTTDHGGTARVHGGQTPEERTIFLAVNGPGVQQGLVLEEEVGHTAVPPTVFKYLGVRIDPAWGWVSQPFGLGK